MDIRALILKLLKQRGSVRAAEVVKRTGFSRTYVNRFFKQLRDDGMLVLMGRANTARYFAAKGTEARKAKEAIREIHRTLASRNLAEDVVLRQLKAEAGIFLRLRPNVTRILEYAFTEMLNNAIEHSRSKTIDLRLRRLGGRVDFTIADFGIGIYSTIKRNRHLTNELEAIQELIKGKLTTDPKHHSGEGIFFTSKVADELVIRGSNKKLIFDNRRADVFVKNAKPITGTVVEFSIDEHSKRDLKSVFAHYAGEDFEFAKTVVTVQLFKTEGNYISRSQARRVLTGMDKFKTVILDFKGVDTVGQAFADEVFRVWQKDHPEIQIDTRNADSNVQLIIQHVTKMS